MKDTLGRELTYLRVSITDRCNLRCKYCMPEEGVPLLTHEDVLRSEEFARAVRAACTLGVTRVRLTGGEPLVRKGVAALAEELRRIPGVQFLGITTNGVLLAPLAQALHSAGVDGVNISLDTLHPQRFLQITGRDELRAVLRGLDAALALPRWRVKLNCVLSAFTQAEDILAVAGLAQTRPVDVRFIEQMPGGGITAQEALTHVERAYGPAQPLPAEPGGPAQYFRLQGFAGRLGVIPAARQSFCARCNRLRLSATGVLLPCLFSSQGVALRPLLRAGADDAALAAAILAAARQKPAHGCAQSVAMSTIGG